MGKRDVQIVVLVIFIALVGLMVSRSVAQKSLEEDYVVISVGLQEYKRVSLDEPQTVIIDRDGKHNEVKVTNEGVVMHSSNCESQDCIKQGDVTLENIEKRILGGWIICLPNEVTIELVKGEYK